MGASGFEKTEVILDAAAFLDSGRESRRGFLFDVRNFNKYFCAAWENYCKRPITSNKNAERDGLSLLQLVTLRNDYMSLLFIESLLEKR